ncbi:MAG: hypothetical protein ACRDGM_04375, partial [bacterium]
MPNFAIGQAFQELFYRYADLSIGLVSFSQLAANVQKLYSEGEAPIQILLLGGFRRLNPPNPPG